MTDDNTDTQGNDPEGAQTTANEQSGDAGQKPPWERDGEEFNAEKAWTLIQHLRDDNAKLKTTNEATGAKLKEFEDAKLTEQEKLERDLKETREQLAQANIAKAWADARAKHPQLTEQDFDLIGGGSPEEIADKAAKLAARIDAQAASDANQNINPLYRKPATPSGGTDPTSTPSKDWLREAMTNQ